MKQTPSPFVFTYRVRYADVDQMGVAYHSRYLEWYEAARTELLRDRGYPYKKIETRGFFLPVVEAHCRYMQPVRYDDLIEITVLVDKASRLRVTLLYQLSLQGETEIRAEGYTDHCFVNADGRPVRIPSELLKIFKQESLC